MKLYESGSVQPEKDSIFEQVWRKYDRENCGVIEKEAAKKLVNENLSELGPYFCSDEMLEASFTAKTVTNVDCFRTEQLVQQQSSRRI